MQEVIVWPGAIAGALIGVFLVAQYWLTGKPLGCSTAYGNVCGVVSKAPFFHSGEYTNLNNWRLWFVLGLPLGGLLGSLTSGGLPVLSFDMGTLYESVLPQSLWLRALYLVFGGSLIGLGARLAGGCQSGHSINGMALLNPPSFIASIGFFVGGIVVVQALFGWLG
jgi:uncharacterized membrane protein YedE/YeeE